MTKPVKRNKPSKASDYTHSPWSGKRYARKQTTADLIAESMAILGRHPTIRKLLPTFVNPEPEAAQQAMRERFNS